MKIEEKDIREMAGVRTDKEHVIVQEYNEVVGLCVGRSDIYISPSAAHRLARQLRRIALRVQARNAPITGEGGDAS